MAIITEGNHQAEFLLGELDSLSLDTVTLITGQNIKSGTVLGKITASGKYTLHNNAASDGSEVAVAISLNDVDATSADTPCVIVARMQEVILSKLIFKDGISAPNKTAALGVLATKFIIARESM